jgi:hypothetical protein
VEDEHGRGIATAIFEATVASDEIETDLTLIADRIHEGVMEWLNDHAWPKCLDHEHPLSRCMVEDQAVWRCTADKSRYWRIGELATASSKQSSSHGRPV